MFEVQQDAKPEQIETSEVTLDDYRHVFEEIYRNRYFTNHGPLAKEFEKSLELLLGVGDVVVVGNCSLALLVTLAGLELDGELVLPAFCASIPASVASWLDLDLVFCDVCATTHQPDLSLVKNLDVQHGCAVLVETWGYRCDPEVVNHLVSRGCKVVVVAFDSLEVSAESRPYSANPQVIIVSSFATSVSLGSLQVGVIATQNAELANRFRNIRSSYGAREIVDVLATCNGRFSELQAGIGLRSLSKLPGIIQHRRQVFDGYEKILKSTPLRSQFEFSRLGESHGCTYPIQLSQEQQARGKAFLADRNITPCEPLSRFLRSGECPTSRSLSAEIFLMPVSSCNNSRDASELAEQLLHCVDDEFLGRPE